jgi:hypothetical protein
VLYFHDALTKVQEKVAELTEQQERLLAAQEEDFLVELTDEERQRILEQLDERQDEDGWEYLPGSVVHRAITGERLLYSEYRRLGGMQVFINLVNPYPCHQYFDVTDGGRS